MSNLGEMLRVRKLMIPLTLQELSAATGVSTSHLGRVENGNRFPSARVLRKIAKPLGFEEEELLTCASYLSPKPPVARSEPDVGQLDPYVAKVLSEEPVDIQRTVIGILAMLKSIAQGSVGPAKGN